MSCSVRTVKWWRLRWCGDSINGEDDVVLIVIKNCCDSAQSINRLWCSCIDWRRATMFDCLMAIDEIDHSTVMIVGVMRWWGSSQVDVWQKVSTWKNSCAILVTTALKMTIVAGDLLWVAIFMVTVNFVGYQKYLATKKLMTVVASSLIFCLPNFSLNIEHHMMASL